MNSAKEHSSYCVRIIWLGQSRAAAAVAESQSRQDVAWGQHKGSQLVGQRGSEVQENAEGVEVLVQVDRAQMPTVADLSEALFEAFEAPSSAAKKISAISAEDNAKEGDGVIPLVIDGREFAPHVLLDECPLFEGVEVMPAATGSAASSATSLEALNATKSTTPIVTGSAVSNATGSATPRSVVAAIGGIDSGQQIGLGAHPVVVGRSPAADLRIDHPEVSQRHLQIQNRQVLDLDSSNGVTLEGRPVADRAEIAPEQRIGAGGAVVTWRLLEDDSLDVSGSPPKLMFNRPPRSLPPASAKPFRVGGKRSDGGLLPVRPPTWATFAIPLALGLVLAVLFSPYMALFALLGPAMAVSSWLEGRGRNKKDLRSRKRQTAKDREEFKAHCQKAAAQETARRRFEHPDPAACLQWAVAPAARLWERSRADADFLHLSIGRYDAPWQPPIDIAEGGGSASQLPEELADLRDATTLRDVPFVADFSKGVIGIVGPRREALARWLIMQAATRYGPSDLNIAVAGSERDWGWASWLPHFRSAEVGNSADGSLGSRNSVGGSLVGGNLAAGGLAAGNSAAGIADGSQSPVAQHTLAVWAHPSAGFLGDRFGGRNSVGGSEAWANSAADYAPATARPPFLTSGTEVWANSAADLSGASRNQPSPQAKTWANSATSLSGTSLVVLAETPDELPSDCSVSIQLLDDAGRCRVTGWPRTVLADGISRATARQAALRLARFEDPLANAAGLPQTVSLVSLLGLRAANDIPPERVQQEWQRNLMAAPMAATSPEAASALQQEWKRNFMAAPIGWSDGEIIYLDLIADGPHGLIAGTTGSGKSELMRCLVASLAFTTSPEQLNFVLIDYKGGSAFDACAGLPHVVGLVTDLDERLGERALVCMRAELAYREQFLRTAQAASISELSPSRSSSRSPLQSAEGETAADGTRSQLFANHSHLPRLLVVIDEFAALASELPGFLESLVDIAQRGRSLGVHLLLGTQRPAGVVSPSIRSNTNIRIGLRMLDPHDSEDVIGTPAAAAIDQGSPGRAYVRYGSGQPMPFQVAAVSGISPSLSDKPVIVKSRMAMQTGGSKIGGSRTDGFEAWHSETDHLTEAKTDLQRLVAAIGEAWEQTESQPLRCPWPEPLPTELDLEELREQMASGGIGAVLPGLNSGAGTSRREQMASGEVGAVAGAEASGVADAVALGLEDHPEEQTRRICLWHPAEKNLLLIGLVGSGASETLLTAVLQLAEARDISALQIFGIDYGTSNLAQLAGLPHCKSILGPAEVGQRTELLEFMFEELAKRQMRGRGVGSEAEDEGEKQTTDATMSKGFVATTGNREVGNRAVKNREAGNKSEQWSAEGMNEQVKNKSAPPQTLLLIDNLGALLHALEDERDYRRIEKLTRLYLDGPSWGIATAAVAESLAAVPRKFFSAATMQLLFRVSDSSPYGPANIDASRLGFGRAFLIGGGAVAGGASAAAGGMTRGGIAGRGGTTGPVEVQAAVVSDLPKAISDIARNPAELATAARDGYASKLPTSDVAPDPAELATQSHASPKPQQSSPQESRQFSPQQSQQSSPQASHQFSPPRQP